jgi:VanZ family protein
METQGAAEKRRLSFAERLPIPQRRARRWAVAWGLFLLALTSWPSPPEVPVVSQIPDFDKMVHFGLYGVEGFLLYFAVVWPDRRFSWLRVATIAAAVAVWGMLDEVHQAFIPGRFMEGADVMGDLAGGTLGAIVASWVSRAAPIPPSRPRTSPSEDSGRPAPSLRANRSSGS